ncbi:MAG TPA: hypothetical protein VGB00_15505 [Pyrinomonadaceae bacterium]|jgi:hypothetical protein
MKRFTNPLDNIRVASPCAADWNEMRGDERKRFCSECSLNVYNLSGMTRDEAENLLLTAEGRVCVRFYRRQDGTILTKDCPVGWQLVKRRASRAATAVVSLCAGIFTGIFAFQQPKREAPKAAETTPVKRVPPSFTQAVESLDGDTLYENVMREAIVPTAGMPINLDDVRKDIKKNRKR